MTQSAPDSQPRPGPFRRTAALLAIAAAAMPLGAQEAAFEGDPFEMGLRWRDSSGDDASWIPRSLAFAGRGELVFAAHAVSSPRLALYPAGGRGALAPSHLDTSVAAALGPAQVVGGAGVNDLFALSQYPGSGTGLRETRITAHDRLAAATGGGFAPAWTYTHPTEVSGNALFDGDEAGLVVALNDPSNARIHLDWIDPATGQHAGSTTFPGTGLTAVSCADGAARVAVAIAMSTAPKHRVLIFANDGSLVFEQGLGVATGAIALSGDGNTLAVGGTNSVQTFVDDGSGFGAHLDLVGPTGMVATRVALSRAAETLAIGWWDPSPGTSLALEARDGGTGTVLLGTSQSSSPQGLQNLPEAVLVSPDGQRIAFGVWGAQTPHPEVLLYDRASSLPLLSANLEGSVFAMSLDHSGTRLAVGVKDGHANLFGTEGQTLLFDTGERELQVVGRPSLGGQLRLVANAEAAPGAVFLIGLAGPALEIPGIGGPLQLDPWSPLTTIFAPSAEGTAGVVLPIPDKNALGGIEIAAQALVLDSAGPFFAGGSVMPVLH